MAYIYQVRFDIDPDQMNQLEIGASLERVLAYLRALLPSQMGYISAQAMFSLNIPDRTQPIFQSIWETWDDIDATVIPRFWKTKYSSSLNPMFPWKT